MASDIDKFENLAARFQQYGGRRITCKVPRANVAPLPRANKKVSRYLMYPHLYECYPAT